MPIATCIVSESRVAEVSADDIVEVWSAESGIAADEMTVTVVGAADQGGRRYDVMAWLYLPDLWSDEEVVVLQEALAAAWSEVLGATEVQVITSLVASGLAVEHGSTVHW